VCEREREREKEREIEADGEKERKEGVGVLGYGLPPTRMSEQKLQTLQHSRCDTAVQCFNNFCYFALLTVKIILRTPLPTPTKLPQTRLAVTFEA
jgi:hypothetical protein